MSLGDLHGLKSKLEALESKISVQMQGVKQRGTKMEKVESVYQDYISKQKRVNFNVCGVMFTTSVLSIQQHKGTLFNSMIDDLSLISQESIFLDRDPKIFGYLFDYIRNKSFNFKRLTKQEIFDLSQEAEYFEVWEVVDQIDLKYTEPKVVGMSFSGEYHYKGKISGTNRPEDLNNTETNTGICATIPGRITVELNKECEFNELTVHGFKGDPKAWYEQNGNGAKILVSNDQLKWELVGKVKFNGQSILNKTVCAKYIKFESDTYLGIGYLKVVNE
mmetsp:Transcript_14045/g.14556  ORF Transcript_14045/g.14556 Transcript_14045/m.14556 type:complete len:276 (-) Transcript_14045:36-863(-)